MPPPAPIGPAEGLPWSRLSGTSVSTSVWLAYSPPPNRAHEFNAPHIVTIVVPAVSLDFQDFMALKIIPRRNQGNHNFYKVRPLLAPHGPRISFVVIQAPPCNAGGAASGMVAGEPTGLLEESPDTPWQRAAC
jgi:hypothetical protein